MTRSPGPRHVTASDGMTGRRATGANLSASAATSWTPRSSVAASTRIPIVPDQVLKPGMASTPSASRRSSTDRAVV
jgi:hypothetical protein